MLNQLWEFIVWLKSVGGGGGGERNWYIKVT